jgi:SAM-dependent methyltransferase
MDDANREQVEFWNGPQGRRWVTHQETLDRVWRPIGEPALGRAAVQQAERVIDVGCGCGGTSLELSARVGPAGSVIGIDISAPMLARARERAHALEVANLEFVEADASTYRFAGDADLVFSRVGVMFFRDPVTAFANLRRALRPGGRFVFVCFRDRQLNSWWTIPLGAAGTVIPAEPLAAPHEPGPFSLADESRLRAVLNGSGFAGVVCEPADQDIVLADDVDSATEFAVNAGPVARVVAGASDENRALVRAAIRQSLARFAGPGGVSLHAATWIVQARNPAPARL